MAWGHILPLEHLYVHWPFCTAKCDYCPFVSFVGHERSMRLYAQALCREMKIFSEQIMPKDSIQTVYFGGGTPSTCPHDVLLDIFGTLKNMFGFHQMAEITLEVNPRGVTREQVSLWKKMGITRVSIGVQSLEESALKKLNRHQSRHDVAAALECCAREFDDISIDLMIGLPQVSDVQWQAMVREVLAWPITHISLYILTVHEGTPLHQQVKSGVVKLDDENTIMELYTWTCQTLRAAGFDHYEISNFARAGKYSRHNLAYWERKPYRGFGLAAASFDGKRRMVNTEHELAYCAAMMRHESAIAFEEELTPEQVRMEKIMLGLRSCVGVQCEDILGTEHTSHRVRRQECLQELCQQGFIEEYQGKIRLTMRGMAVENSVAARLA